MPRIQLKFPHHLQHVMIVAHVYTTVPIDDLTRFLCAHKIASLLVVTHPLIFHSKAHGSRYVLYHHGVKVREHSLALRRFPLPVQYCYDFVLTLWWGWKFAPTCWDAFIALENIGSFAGLILRLFGRAKKVIYYTIDFVPTRFANHFMNEFYHRLDEFCVQWADSTWNVSPRIAEARQQQRGLDLGKKDRQITVPIGAWFDTPSETERKYLRKGSVLVYAGGLAPHQGIQEVLRAVPLILKKIPRFQLQIIGIGSYEETLHQIVSDLKIGQAVNFLGYQKKHEDVMRLLRKADLGIALYSRDLDQWSRFADPSKIKSYLAAGLPVITTDVTHISSQLVQQNCGVIVPYEAKAVADQVTSLLKDTSRRQNMQKAAIVFAQQFDWNRIFTRAFLSL